MSNYRFGLLFSFFIVVALLGLAQIFLHSSYLSTPSEYVLYPGRGSERVKLRHWQGEEILVDHRNQYRSVAGQKLINPLVLSSDKLLEYSDDPGQDQAWQVFSRLYRDYYGKYYRERFDKSIDRFGKEVRLAYDYWQRQAP